MIGWKNRHTTSLPTTSFIIRYTTFLKLIINKKQDQCKCMNFFGVCGIKLFHLDTKLQTTFASSHHNTQLPTRALQLMTLGNQIIIFSSPFIKLLHNYLLCILKRFMHFLFTYSQVSKSILQCNLLSIILCSSCCA